MKVRELLPHIAIGPQPIVIPLKLFLERIGFLAHNISSRIAWMFRGGAKVQKHVGIPRECGSCDDCETTVYPLLMRNRFFRDSFFFEHVSMAIGIGKKNIVRRFTKEIQFEIKC